MGTSLDYLHINHNQIRNAKYITSIVLIKRLTIDESTNNKQVFFSIIGTQFM
jgi:hypothetical protein